MSENGEKLFQAFELAGEVAHELGFPSDFETAFDGFATVVHILEGGGDDIHVVVGVDTTGDAEAHEVVATKAVFTGHGVAVGQDVANFASTDTGFKVELAGKGLGGELFLGNLGEDSVGIDKDGVTTGGTLVGDAVFVEFGGEVLDLLDAGFDHVELNVLFQTNGEGVHIAAIHTAIGEEAFEGDAEELGTFVPVFLVGGDETTHVDQTIFLGAHGHAVGIAEHFAGDFAEGLVGIAFFTGFDEIGVLDETGAVHVDGDTVFVAEFAGFADVLHADGLTADGVVGDGEDHEGDIALIFLEHLFEFLEADIAFEGDFELGVVGFGDGDIDGEGLAALDVALGGVEVGVAGHNHAGFYEVAEQDVLSSTALVGGDDIVEAGELGDGVLHVEEAAGSAVAFVTHHHGAPLAVAHGAGAGVGEEVDVDVIALQHENVLVGFFEPFFALFAGGFLDRFNHLDFPRFCKW